MYGAGSVCVYVCVVLVVRTWNTKGCLWNALDDCLQRLHANVSIVFLGDHNPSSLDTLHPALHILNADFAQF